MEASPTGEDGDIVGFFTRVSTADVLNHEDGEWDTEGAIPAYLLRKVGYRSYASTGRRRRPVNDHDCASGEARPMSCLRSTG